MEIDLSLTKSFMDYVTKSPTAYHAIREAERILQEKGFQKCESASDYVPGGRYYKTRNGSSLIAFALPECKPTHFQLVCSHSDSPMFVLKEHPDNTAAHYVRLNTEVYGGTVLHTWLDRPLGIAGRIVVRKADGTLYTMPVDFERDMCVIPGMCIHLMRELNDGVKLNPQVDLQPLWGPEGIRTVRKSVRRENVRADEEIVSSDLYLYNRTPGCIFGEDAYFSCPRIDNLECAYTSLLAFADVKPQCAVNVCAIFDNEEVGSSTKQGADSDFLSEVLCDVCDALGMTAAERRNAIARSMMVSADNAHAVHPNHPEKFDEQNRGYLNGGIVIKHAANQRYTTDAVSGALFIEICNRAGVRVQHFHNRSDLRGGSTLGNIANTHVSMPTVDIGLPQLSMHSSYETAGTADLIAMVRALRVFYATDIRIEGDLERFELNTPEEYIISRKAE